MFEILKALLAVQKACKQHGTSLRWEIGGAEADYGIALKAEIPLTPEDQRFVKDMQRMFEPVDSDR